METEYYYVAEYRGSKYIFRSLDSLRYGFIETLENRPYMNKTTVRAEMRRLLSFHRTGWGKLFYGLSDLNDMAYKHHSYDAQIYVLHDAYSKEDTLYRIYDADDPAAEITMCEDAMNFLGGYLYMRSGNKLQNTVAVGDTLYTLWTKKPDYNNVHICKVLAIGEFTVDGKKYDYELHNGFSREYASHDQFGSTLFLTKAECFTALKELQRRLREHQQ